MRSHQKVIHPEVYTEAINCLPVYLLHQIFHYYVKDMAALFHLRTVCRHWCTLLSNSLLWITVPLTIQAPLSYCRLLQKVLKERSTNPDDEYSHFCNTIEDMPVFCENYRLSAKVHRIEILREEAFASISFQNSPPRLPPSQRKSFSFFQISPPTCRGKSILVTTPTSSSSRSSTSSRYRNGKSKLQSLEYYIVQAHDIQQWFIPLFRKYHRGWREHTRREELLERWKEFFLRYERSLQIIIVGLLALMIYGAKDITRHQSLSLSVIEHVMFSLAYVQLVLDSVVLMKPLVCRLYRFDERILIEDDLTLPVTSKTEYVDCLTVIIFLASVLMTLILVQIKLATSQSSISWMLINLPLWIGTSMALVLWFWSVWRQRNLYNRVTSYPSEDTPLPPVCWRLIHGLLLINGCLALLFIEVYFNCSDRRSRREVCFTIPKEVRIFSTVLCLLSIAIALFWRKRQVLQLFYVRCTNEYGHEESTPGLLITILSCIVSVLASGLSLYLTIILGLSVVYERDVRGFGLKGWLIAQSIMLLLISLHLSWFSEDFILSSQSRTEGERRSLIIN